jgi:hypothetical protein
MKRLILILLLIPSLVFATYTEFYCQSGGSNLNACSTTNNTAVYTSVSGNWTNATGVFTPTDGTTPASTVSVGMWASVYVDGASVGVYIGRISAVGAGANGTITANTSGTGSKPANQTGTATIKVGGACLGPNAASGYPLTLTSFGVNQDSSSHMVRLNLKNDQTYSMTSSFAIGSASGNPIVVQGYTSSVGDGGRATLDGGTSTGVILSGCGVGGNSFADLIFKTSISSGTSSMVTAANALNAFRCVFTGARRQGLLLQTTNNQLTECEFYGNNTSVGSGIGAVEMPGNTILKRCIAHDNAGSACSGFLTSGPDTAFFDCIADTNGQYGISSTSTASPGYLLISHCDFYNNGSNGINIVSGDKQQVWIENANFIKNTGAGISNSATGNMGFIFNCGYGAGTQANGSADTLNNLVTSGAVTYGSNLTPWVDPANGDFRINLAAAQGTGRSAFTETAASYTGTIGYPDIGAAQSSPAPTCAPTPTPCAGQRSYTWGN